MVSTPGRTALPPASCAITAKPTACYPNSAGPYPLPLLSERSALAPHRRPVRRRPAVGGLPRHVGGVAPWWWGRGGVGNSPRTVVAQKGEPRTCVAHPPRPRFPQHRGKNPHTCLLTANADLTPAVFRGGHCSHPRGKGLPWLFPRPTLLSPVGRPDPGRLPGQTLLSSLGRHDPGCLSRPTLLIPREASSWLFLWADIMIHHD